MIYTGPWLSSRLTPIIGIRAERFSEIHMLELMPNLTYIKSLSPPARVWRVSAFFAEMSWISRQ